MNKFLIIHGMIIFLGVFVSDSYCSKCQDKGQAEQLSFKTYQKRVDPLKSNFKDLKTLDVYDSVFYFHFYLVFNKFEKENFSVGLYENSNLTIRAPPIA